MDTITEAVLADEVTLRIERRLAAPRELVFAAWTEPRHLRRWSAPHGFEITEAEGELRAGGGWRATMRAPDGTDYRLAGTYREIVAARAAGLHPRLARGRRPTRAGDARHRHLRGGRGRHADALHPDRLREPRRRATATAAAGPRASSGSTPISPAEA